MQLEGFEPSRREARAPQARVSTVPPQLHLVIKDEKFTTKRHKKCLRFIFFNYLRYLIFKFVDYHKVINIRHKKRSRKTS